MPRLSSDGMIGRTIGNFEITGRIGAGGMGEVFRARDTQLGRDVAMKVLPEAFAADPERLMRFEREARLLASLNHPNIATIHGVERDGSQRILVMEYAEGEDLAARISRGRVPVDEAIEFARQIADALESAHEHGVIHRDLKPANVVVTHDGAVKVLDFGLAKAAEGDAGDSGLSHSPTLLGSSPTAAGVILGTAAYMSPEQARGKRVDRRADIFAFGCVLYEMLTARRVFDGDTVSDTLAAVLRAEPDWNALPGDTPPRIRALLKRCLEKDPKLRLRDIGEARITLASTGTDETTPAAQPAGRRGGLLVWVLASLAVVLSAGWFLTVSRAPHAPEQPVVVASINLPDDLPISLFGAHPGPPAISPDGRWVTLAVLDDDGALLAARNLSTGELRTYPGTDGAGYPFWSPDSREIGFFSNSRLYRVALTGGAPVEVCTSEFGKGGTWTDDGTIVFARSYATAIFRVAATGGTPEAVTVRDTTQSVTSHRFPRILPDQKHFLYVSRRFTSDGRGGHTLCVGSIDGTFTKELFATENDATFANGYLFFVRERELIAQRFDTKTFSLVGDPISLVSDVQTLTGAAHAVFDVSPAGVAVFVQGGNTSLRAMYMVDPAANKARMIGEPGQFDRSVAVSPDGSMLAFAAFNSLGGTADIWSSDIARGTRTRVTFDPRNDSFPIWSPDGNRIAFTTQRNNQIAIVVRSMAGDGAERVISGDSGDVFLTAWSPDGKYILGNEVTPNGNRFVVYPLGADSLEEAVLRLLPRTTSGGLGDISDASFSPDGRWLAYESSESGKLQISAIPFGREGRRWQVTLNGGSVPRWTRDHIYFVKQRALWRIPVKITGEQLTLGDEEKVFDGEQVMFADMTRDAKTIVISSDDASTRVTTMGLIVNLPDFITSKQ